MSAPAIVGLAAKSVRAHQMLAEFRSGMSARAIARKHRLSQRTVHIRLNALGVTFVQQNRADIWNLPEDERRLAFAQRAARGARELLQASP